MARSGQCESLSISGQLEFMLMWACRYNCLVFDFIFGLLKIAFSGENYV